MGNAFEKGGGEMNEWYSLSALVGFPGMPRTIQGTLKKLNREGTRFREVPARGGPGGKRREYHISSLPEVTRIALVAKDRESRSGRNQNSSNEPIPDTSESLELELYSRAPEYNRRKADKYLQILKVSADLKGSALQNFISQWNITNPEFQTSYPRIMEIRKIYAEQGISGLLGQYGKKAGASVVQDEWFETFKKYYLKEGAPSLQTCWVITLGELKQKDPSLGADIFPAAISFQRRLKRDIPESAIYFARYGEAAWNRKYACFIERDYESVTPGECYVSDHAQVDVAVSLPNGKYCFPWVTAWRDFKTSKWLGWLIHPEPPNSDHIFQSFFYAVNDFGLPSYIYVDNGKDYRSRDFAGGRSRSHKLVVDKTKTTAMVGLLGITPIFAIPRNAQAKTIERDFLKNKEYFSKHLKGYRGGNVVERPGSLQREIKEGDIIPWQTFKSAMDEYIKEILNEMPSEGKILKGRSPNATWNEEISERRFVSKEALKLFCMRTSRPVSIMRNEIMGSEIGVRYWAEWMSGMKGKDTKVYLRRDINSYQEAWVFRADDDEYLGRASIGETVAAIAKTDIEKKQLREAMARKKHDKKITKAYAEVKDRPGLSEILSSMKTGIQAIKERKGGTDRTGEQKPMKVYRLKNTRMDDVIRKDMEMLKTGTYDLGVMMPSEHIKKRKIALFECDLEQIREDS